MSLRLLVPGLLLALLLPLSGSTQEQLTFNSAGYKNGFKFSAFKLFSSTFEMSYERFFQKKSSILISANVTAGSNWQRSYIGTGGELQYRMFFNPWWYRQANPNPRSDFYGLYVAPFAQYGYTSVHEEFEFWDWETEISTPQEARGLWNSYGTGVVLGVQYALQHKFLFDFYLGGSARYSHLVTGSTLETIDDNPFHPVYTGILPRAGLKFGIAF